MATPSSVLNAANGSIKKSTRIQGSLLLVKDFKCKSCKTAVQKSPEKK